MFIHIKEKLRLKKFYIPLSLGVTIIGLISYRSYKAAHQPPNYETVTVQRGNLVQTVEATGKLQSTDDVALRFEIPGILRTISVTEGQNVKAGTTLVTLNLAELNAAVAQASANLQQKIAGATSQDRAYYKAALDAAIATLHQAETDAAASITSTQTDVDNAYNNLKLAEGGENSRIVNSAYETGVTTLLVSLAKLDDSLTQSKNAIDYMAVIRTDDQLKRALANSAYATAQQSIATARVSAGGLTTLSSHSVIDQSFNSVEQALSDTILALAKINDALSVVPNPTDSTTQTSLDAKKTAIATARAALTSQYSTTVKERKDIADAKNSYTTYSIAYTKAQHDLEQAKANAKTSIQIKQASLDQAKANYDSKIEPTRAVDLAPYRAAVAQAVASRNKGILRAPMDGTVVKINKKKGELVTSADVLVQMISPHYEIQVDIPEMDITKVFNSAERNVEFSLDAFGSDIKFPGAITSIDKKSTEIQDVVYYQVTIAMATSTIDKPIQAGMTANITIITDHRENVLIVPQRVVRTRDNDEKFVRVLDNNQEIEMTVKLGLKADNGQVEIIDGLTENQTVIISTKK